MTTFRYSLFAISLYVSVPSFIVPTFPLNSPIYVLLLSHFSLTHIPLSRFPSLSTCLPLFPSVYFPQFILHFPPSFHFYLYFCSCLRSLFFVTFISVAILVFSVSYLPSPSFLLLSSRRFYQLLSSASFPFLPTHFPRLLFPPSHLFPYIPPDK